MKKSLRALTSSILWSLKFGAILTLILLALNLFFEGSAFLQNYSLTDLSKDYSFNALVFFLISLLSYINVGRAKPNLTQPPLSKLTKILIIFPGLPLFGLLFSMIFVRLFEILEISMNPIIIITTVTIAFWGYGFYLCKTVFFKT